MSNGYGYMYLFWVLIKQIEILFIILLLISCFNGDVILFLVKCLVFICRKYLSLEQPGSVICYHRMFNIDSSLKNHIIDAFTWIFYRTVPFCNKLTFQCAYKYCFYPITVQNNWDVHTKDRPHELSISSIYFIQGWLYDPFL